MVKSPITVELWQPVAYARQLMLTHSFSFLPVFLEEWQLISESSLARYMRSDKDWKALLSAPIEHAAANGLELINARVVGLKDNIDTLLQEKEDARSTRLWLVQGQHGSLCGVLSPFELM